MEFIYEENRIYLKDEHQKLIAEVTFPYVKDTTVEINHTFVDESLRGQGIASKLLEAVTKELTRRNLKAIPTCSFAVSWFKKHPESKELLEP